jgi:formate hydrogenlyase subunit 4
MTMWLIIILQLAFFLLFAPLLTGWIKWLKCHMQNRTAPSIFQPYQDLNKLFFKQALQVEGASWLFYATPYLLFSIILVASTLVPSFIINSSSPSIGDAIVLVGLLALARFFLALAGLDIGTAFGGMGSSREMMISALAEPSLLLIFLTMAMKADSSSLPVIVDYVTKSSWGIYIYPSFIFVFLSLLMVTITETGRIPIDNPATHLELTMTHEAMILEYSGKYLALIEWVSYMKTMLFFVLISNLFFPWGITNSLTLTSISLSLFMLCSKLFLCGILIVLIETVLAKMRLFRIPYFLGIAFALCLLGILSHILFETVST